MEVMHERVAGLDVHKETIVACVRIVDGGRVSRQCRTLETTTAGLEALLAWLRVSRCTHVAMEACVEHPERRQVRADFGQCGAHQERAWPQDGCERRYMDRRSGRLWPHHSELRPRRCAH
jgi:hypothetical protein